MGNSYPRNDKEIISKLSDPNYEVGNYILPASSSFEDKLKYEICQAILNYQQETQISYQEMSQKAGLPFSEAMNILKKRINNFTLTELVSYLKKLLESSAVPCQVKIILSKETKQ